MIRLVTALMIFTAEAAGHGSGWAQTLDRVVASVGDVAITESDVVREYGLEILIQEGKLPNTPPDAATLDRVRDRLIDQTLLAQETRAEGLEWPGARSAAQQRLAEVRKRFSSAKAFDSALRSLGMSENQFLEVLAAQQRTLRLIEQRLRPAASPGQAEIQTYYRETFLREYAKRSPGAPPRLAEVESQIREILVQKRINEQLTAWLEELRSSRKVKLYPF